jgi:hypothetical protein
MELPFLEFIKRSGDKTAQKKTLLKFQGSLGNHQVEWNISFFQYMPVGFECRTWGLKTKHGNS